MTDIEIRADATKALWLLVNQEQYRIDAMPDLYSPQYRRAIADLKVQLDPYAPADAITAPR